MSEYEEYRRKQREKWERERGQTSNGSDQGSTNSRGLNPSHMNNPSRNSSNLMNQNGGRSNRAQGGGPNRQEIMEKERQEALRLEQLRKDEEFAKRLHEQYQQEVDQQNLEQERRIREDEELARKIQNTRTPEQQRTGSQPQPQQYPQPIRNMNNMTQEERDAEIARQTQLRYYNGDFSPSAPQNVKPDDRMSDEEDEPEHHPQRVEQLVPDQQNAPFGGMFGFNGFPSSPFQQQNQPVNSNQSSIPGGRGTQTVTRISTGPDGSQQIQTTTTTSSSSSSSRSSSNPSHNLFNIQRPTNFSPQRQTNRNQNQRNRNRNRRRNNDPFNDPFFTQNSGFGGMNMNMPSMNNRNRQRRNPQSPLGADFFNFFGNQNMNFPFNTSSGSNGFSGLPPGLQGMLNQFGHLRGFPVPSPQHASYEDLIRLTEQMGHVNRGTDEGTIDENSQEFTVKDVKKEIPKKEGEDNHCTVCYEDFKNGDRVRRLNCMHVFHKHCVDRWLKDFNATCPICREPIKLEDQLENKRKRDQQRSANSQRNSNNNNNNQMPPRPGPSNNQQGNMFL